MDLHCHTSNVTIQDMHKIIDISNPEHLGFNFDQPFWRGHGNAEWSLLPHVFRPDPLHPDAPKYKESGLIGHFQIRAPTRSLTKTPEPNDYFGWLFLAQHYGLPTRLLDWSEGPLIALYLDALVAFNRHRQSRPKSPDARQSLGSHLLGRQQRERSADVGKTPPAGSLYCCPSKTV